MPLFQKRTPVREPVPTRDLPVAANGHDPHPRGREAYYDLKTRIHRQLIERLDLTKLDLLPLDSVQQQIRRIVEDMLVADETPLSRQEREQIVVEVEHETFGLGPLEPLMQDPTVSDILVNGSKTIYVERRGRLERTNVIFRDDTHLLHVIERIVSGIGRRIDESSPMVDARLADGSRVNAIIPPLAIDGPVLSIRRFAVKALTMQDFINYGTISEPMALVLQGVVRARLNVLISGGTGSGKTTTLNIMSGYIPPDERIVTIEDSAELQLQQPHVVRLETRPPNIEGKGQVAARDLVRNSLRMRPDRIVVGEVRGEEVLDMLQAMNTGHEGSLTTVHANSPRGALARVENMVSMANLNIPERAVRHQVASAIHAVVQIARLSDGTRKVITVSEITGMDGESVAMQDIFEFDRTGTDEGGRVRGIFRATGVRPEFAERLATGGTKLRPALFESKAEV